MWAAHIEFFQKSIFYEKVEKKKSNSPVESPDKYCHSQLSGVNIKNYKSCYRMYPGYDVIENGTLPLWSSSQKLITLIQS